MSSLKTLCRIGQASIRNARQMSADKAKIAEKMLEKDLPKDLHPMFYKLKADQKLYQQNDGIPIHFKRGARDKVMYYATWVLSAIGIVASADYVYHLP